MRELAILGTASQAPTRQRNHNGYLLRWDDEVFLFDPGEGSQRQMLHTGISATDLTRICVTHFHGDHCLGLPGMIQRFSLDRVPHPVAVHFPAGGAEYFARLRHATSFYETAELAVEPIEADGQRITLGVGTLEARRLRHPIETYGYRLVEPDGCRILPEKLSAYGIAGPAVGQLLRDGHLDLDGRRVTRDEVSVTRPGQRFAFVMDPSTPTCWSSSRPSWSRRPPSPPRSATSRPARPPGWRPSRGYARSCSPTSPSGTRTCAASPTRPASTSPGSW
ncbi:hypothetical protein GCM10027452_08520 [Micromonospora halotolerans]